MAIEVEVGNGDLALPPPKDALENCSIQAPFDMSESQAATSATRNLLDKTLQTVESLTAMMEDLITEEKATKLLLKQLNLRVKEIGRKYEDLKDHIVQTRQSKEKMEAIAQNLRCSLSPLKNLPTEILIEIFRMAIDEAHAVRRLSLELVEYTPPDRVSLVLSQVCSRWRTILSENSSLWNLLEVGYRRDDGTVQTKAETRRLRDVAKSGTRGGHDISVSHWDLLGHIFLLKTLGGKTVRCRSLGILMRENPTGRWDPRTLTAREVAIYHGGDVPSIDFVVPLLRLASKIAIHGSPPQWAGLPWMALTELLIEHYDYLDIQKVGFCNLLDATPNLKKLQLDFEIDERDMGDAESVSRTHLSLQHLDLHFQHLSGQQCLFGVHLELPDLSTLRLLSFNINSSDVEEFKFTSWSPKRLVLPELHEHEVTAAAQLLSQLPNIKQLELSGVYSDIIIEYIQAGYIQSKILSTAPVKPKLTALRLTGTDIKGDKLLSLVQGRLICKRADRAGAFALEEISMYDTPGVSPEYWWAIQALLKEGKNENSMEPQEQ